jgi:hypothetical protein
MILIKMMSNEAIVIANKHDASTHESRCAKTYLNRELNYRFFMRLLVDRRKSYCIRCQTKNVDVPIFRDVLDSHAIYSKIDRS